MVALIPLSAASLGWLLLSRALASAVVVVH